MGATSSWWNQLNLLAWFEKKKHSRSRVQHNILKKKNIYPRKRLRSKFLVQHAWFNWISKINLKTHTLWQNGCGRVKKFIWIIYERRFDFSVHAIFAHSKKNMYVYRLPDGYPNTAVHIVVSHGCYPILAMFVSIFLVKTIVGLQKINRNTCQHTKSNQLYFFGVKERNKNQYIEKTHS